MPRCGWSRKAAATDTVAPEVRKTVTVLIARRPTARGLDPEALSHQNKLYRDHLARTVERYGGAVASSLGDAVMAVFGVPQAHEDDASRAVSAAFEIRDAPVGEAIGSGIAPRVGIATGEVLASGSGAGALSVVGEPVTAAGELEDAAAAGEILVGSETERLIRATATGAQVDTEAGRAWRVSELRPGRPALGSLKAPLVGRRPELGRLREAFARVAGEQTLHLFTILGTAGIGKSRLAQEFATEAAEKATVVVGRCVPYGEGITFWSLREISAAHALSEGGHENGAGARREPPPGGRRVGGLGRARGDLLGNADAVCDAGRTAAAGRLLRGRSLGGAHVPRPGRVPGRANAGCADPPRLHRPPGAPRAATRLDP